LGAYRRRGDQLTRLVYGFRLSTASRRGGPTSPRRGSGAATRFEQSAGIVERQRRRVHTFWHRGVDLTVRDVRTVPAFEDLQRRAPVWLIDLRDDAPGRRLATTGTLWLGEEFQRARQFDREETVRCVERAVIVAVLDVRAKTPEACDDRFS
jgi:hypothetical protein